MSTVARPGREPGDATVAAGGDDPDDLLQAERHRSRVLALVARTDERLGAVVAAGGGIAGLVEAASELLGRAVAVHDRAGHRVAGTSGTDAVRLPLEHPGDEVAEVLAAAPRGGTATVPPSLAGGRPHRHLVAPVDLGRERFGWVVVPERPRRFGTADDRVVRRVAAHVGLELTVQRRAAHAAHDARATLARLLIRGLHDSAETVRCATVLGIDLQAPRVVAYLREAGDARPVDGDALAAALSEEGIPGVLSTNGPEGIAMMVEVPPDEPPLRAVAHVREALVRACRAVDRVGLVVGLSTRCRDLDELTRAYHEARDAARCVAQAAGSTGRVLAVDDLGAARLFIANADRPAIDRFVDDVLGPLLRAEPELSGDLLRTLETLFRCGRHVRHTAVVLGIHENTVRYRLARIEGLTGLDVAADPHAQLSVQTALLVLRLRRHPALPPLGTPLAVDGADA